MSFNHPRQCALVSAKAPVEYSTFWGAPIIAVGGPQLPSWEPLAHNGSFHTERRQPSYICCDSRYQPDGVADNPVHRRVGVEAGDEQLVPVHPQIPHAECRRAAATLHELMQHAQTPPGGALRQCPSAPSCNRSDSRSGQLTEWGRPPIDSKVAPSNATGGPKSNIQVLQDGSHAQYRCHPNSQIKV